MLKVEIKVKHRLDPQWAEWLENVDVTHTGEDETTLRGVVADQAALYGLLTRVRDLGLALLSVSIKGSDECSESEVGTFDRAEEGSKGG